MKKSFRKYSLLFRQEFFFNLKNVFVIIFALAFPSFMLVFFGSLFGNTITDEFSLGYINTSLIGFMCYCIGMVTVFLLPQVLAEYREKKILKRYKATPVSPFALLSSQVLANFSMMVAGIGLMLIFAFSLYTITLPGSVILIILCFFLAIIAMYGLGLLIAGLAPSTKSATGISALLFFPQMFLSGATFPYEIMPKGVKIVADCLPLTNCIKLLKGVSFQQPFTEFYGSLIYLIVFAAASLILVKFTFKYE